MADVSKVELERLFSSMAGRIAQVIEKGGGRLEH